MYAVCLDVLTDTREMLCLFYTFPANIKMRGKWIAAVKRANWQPSASSRLSSAHSVTDKYCITDNTDHIVMHIVLPSLPYCVAGNCSGMGLT